MYLCSHERTVPVPKPFIFHISENVSIPWTTLISRACKDPESFRAKDLTTEVYPSWALLDALSRKDCWTCDSILYTQLLVSHVSRVAVVANSPNNHATMQNFVVSHGGDTSVFAKYCISCRHQIMIRITELDHASESPENLARTSICCNVASWNSTSVYACCWNYFLFESRTTFCTAGIFIPPGILFFDVIVNCWLPTSSNRVHIQLQLTITVCPVFRKIHYFLSSYYYWYCSVSSG